MELMTTAALCAGLTEIGKLALSKVSDKASDAAVELAHFYWGKVKHLLGMTIDPPSEKVAEKVTTAVTQPPDAAPVAAAADVPQLADSQVADTLEPASPKPVLATAVSPEAVNIRPELRAQLQELLQNYEQAKASALVGTIHVEKGNVNVIGNHSGDINTNMNF